MSMSPHLVLSIHFGDVCTTRQVSGDLNFCMSKEMSGSGLEGKPLFVGEYRHLQIVWCSLHEVPTALKSV